MSVRQITLLYTSQTSLVSITAQVLQDKFKETSFHISIVPSCFISFHNICSSLCQTFTSHHVCQNFSNLWGSEYWKIYFTSLKTKSRHFCSCAPKQNCPQILIITGKNLVQVFISILSPQRKITNFLSQCSIFIFFILFLFLFSILFY